MEAAKTRYVGHSAKFSIDEALHDAAQQALGTVPDTLVQFHVVNIRGRLGGIGALRDVWVEIQVGDAGEAKDTEPRYTTLALGEEGGEHELEQEQEQEQEQEPEEEPRMTTMAVGEEGGEDSPAPASGG